MGWYAVLLLSLLLLPPVAAQVEAGFIYTDVDFYFNAPRDQVDRFEVNLTLMLYNFNNQSAALVSDLKAELDGEAAQRGVTVSLEKSYVRVEPEDSAYVRITFMAPSSMAEGSYDAELTVTGNYTYVGGGGSHLLLNQFYISVNVEHPPPTLSAVWDLADWGRLRAGQSFERTLTVREVFGYAAAENISVYLSITGPAELNYTPLLGEVPAGGSRRLSVAVRVPERNLKPGDYSVVPRFVKPSDVDVAQLQSANYTIPEPVMAVSTTALDFGKITFEAGRDTSTRSISVNETGGYTPIEGLEVILEKGEEGWISVSGADYVPPGGSISLNFSLALPPDASLGKKSWVFVLKGGYAGSLRLEASATVYFPGLEDAERRLQALEEPEYTQVLASLRQLISASKEVTELREIAMVMAVYSGVVAFVESFSGLEEQPLEEKVDVLLLTRSSLSRAKTGAASLQDGELRSLAIPAVEALEAVWEQQAGAVVAALEERLKEERDYRSAALDSRRLSTLYSLLGDAQKAESYSSKQEQLERAYYDALRKAAELLRRSEEEVSQAKMLTLNLKEASFVLNPFHYEEVVSRYERAISLAEEAIGELEKAGEVEEAQLVASRVEELSMAKRGIERSFTAYLGLLTAAFLWFVARVTLGMLRWMRDSEILAEGDVVLGGKTEL